MPGLARYQREIGLLPTDHSSEPERMPLHLPSSIPVESCGNMCVSDIASIEARLREAQCSEALAELRTQLIKRTYTNKYKERTASSQRAYTRFRTLQNHTEAKIKSAQIVYNTARAALFALKGAGSWEDRYQVLNREDVRGMHERGMTDEEKEEHKRTRRMAGFTEQQIDGELDSAPNMPTVQFDPVLALGEGSRQLSWIWYSISERERQTGDVDGCTFCPIGRLLSILTITLLDLRVEWLKCRARSQRWTEEVSLLKEEMRRSIAYCRWKATWWSQQSERLGCVDPVLAEGLVAYASQQMAFESRRATAWEGKWFTIRSRAQLIKQLGFGDDESTTSIPELEVDLDEEEDEDVVGREVDDEDNEE